MTRQRRHVVYLAWSVNRGRVVELGSLLDAHPRLFYPPRLAGRRLKAVRYLVSVLWTAYVVLRERPTVVLVVNPPVLAAASVVAFARLSGAAVLLDSHPGGFGAQGDRLSARLQPLHRWAVPTIPERALEASIEYRADRCCCRAVEVGRDVLSRSWVTP